MPVYTSHIGSLLNGVSRQTPQLRLRSQGEEMINGYPTLQKGLGKRPPLKYRKNLGSTTGWTDIKGHWINRDSLERYHIQFKNGDLRVFDLDGNAKTVNFPDGKSYLTVTDPKTDFSVLTVADYTFIVNRTVTATMNSGDVSAALAKDALVHIKSGNYARRYKVIINGTTIADYLTADGSDRSHGPTIDPVQLAKTIEYLLETNQATVDANALPQSVTGREITGTNWDSSSATGTGALGSAPWTVTRYDNALHIQNSTSDFTLAVEDGFNGSAMKGIKGAINDFVDLPLLAPVGFKIKITGDNANDYDDFWLEYQKGANDAEGTWKECIAPSTVQSLDAATMPHILVREGDGTFTFKKATWSPRAVGDSNSCPDPAFVGQKISDVAFFRNRLAIMAGENISLSASGDYFNFFIETVTTALDSDPIDVGLSTDTVANIYHGRVLSNDLLLFSDQRQLRLTGGDLLTPSSTAIRDLSTFLVDPIVEPVVVGERIYFAKNFGMSTSVREYWVDQQTQNAEELEITNHCPEFVPGGVYEMAGSSNLNMLALLTTKYPGRIYNHHFFWAQDGSKPQSAWGYWELPSGHTVVGCEFFDTDLFIVTAYQSEYHLMCAPMEVGVTDTNQSWLTYIDYRVHSSDLTPVYDGVNDWTTVTMPYVPPATIEAWTAPGGTNYGPGSNLGTLTVVGNSVRIPGDVTAEPFYIGIPYTFRWRFSELFLKDNQDSPMVDGRSQVLRMVVWFADSASFTVDVTPKNKNKFSYDYTAVGMTTDDPETLYEDVILQDGDFRFPIKCQHDRVAVDLINSSALPSWFISAEFRVLFQPRYRRV